MKKALIVGLNKYPAGNEMNWCDNDATAMSGLLESNGDGSPNFDVIQIIDKCDHVKLSNAICKLFSDDADIALLYYSGHGSDEDGGYLVTTDCDKGDIGVKMTEVLERANGSRCKNKIVILDQCH